MNGTPRVYFGRVSITFREAGEKILLALIFIGAGIVIYTVFSPYRPLLDKTIDYAGRIFLILSFTGIFVLVKRNRNFKKYSPLSIGFLIMAVAVTLDWICGIYLIEYLGVSGNTPVGFALMKLNESIIIVATVVSLTILFGGSLGSIYLQKGDLKLSLLIGITTFCLAAAGSVPMAHLFFKGEGLTLSRIIPWIPWILVSVIANGFQEELILRGLFLRKLQPFLGKFSSNLVIALVFTLLHKGVSYTSSEWIFLAVLVPLALAWGYLMQKTDGIWTSFLFHAGMDIPIILGIFAGMR